MRDQATRPSNTDGWLFKTFEPRGLNEFELVNAAETNLKSRKCFGARHHTVPGPEILTDSARSAVSSARATGRGSRSSRHG